jgi:hypothetical protein
MTVFVHCDIIVALHHCGPFGERQPEVGRQGKPEPVILDGARNLLQKIDRRSDIDPFAAGEGSLLQARPRKKRRGLYIAALKVSDRQVNSQAY